MIMSLASGVIPASRFMHGILSIDGGFHARTDFRKNCRFFYKYNFLPPSGVTSCTNQKLRLLKSSKIQGIFKWRDGLDHVAASFHASSSCNDNVGDFKDCGRVEGVKKEAINVDGSDTSTGKTLDFNLREDYGHGNGDSGGNHGGGGDDGGTGSGGLGESADWEGLGWICWQFFKAWKYDDDSVKIDGCVEKMVELDLDGLDWQLTVLVLLLLHSGLIPVAIGVALTYAGTLLFCCVVAALIWFWPSRQP